MSSHLHRGISTRGAFRYLSKQSCMRLYTYRQVTNHEEHTHTRNTHTRGTHTEYNYSDQHTTLKPLLSGLHGDLRQPILRSLPMSDRLLYIYTKSGYCPYGMVACMCNIRMSSVVSTYRHNHTLDITITGTVHYFSARQKLEHWSANPRLLEIDWNAVVCSRQLTPSRASWQLRRYKWAGRSNKTYEHGNL